MEFRFWGSEEENRQQRAEKDRLLVSDDDNSCDSTEMGAFGKDCLVNTSFCTVRDGLSEEATCQRRFE